MTRRTVWLFAISVLGLACSHGAAFSPSEGAGLGTAWGETRASSVQLVGFEREAPSQPVAVVALYYDDADGVGAAAAEPGFAAPPAWPAGQPPGPLRARLVDAWGAPLPTVQRGGRTYVVGRRGERYAIEIYNQSGGRVEAVTSVDGLDVLDGGPGSWEKGGYVLDPWQTYRIEGFRQSMHEVAAFRFGDVSESYAAATGDATNVGVVGVAFFAERGRWRRGDADPFPGER
jgi:hypothetical protein